jgi:hypothetical protein
MRFGVVIVIELAICAIQPLHAEGWRQFRGPNFNGVIEKATVPGTWGENKNLAWKADVPGTG